MSKSASVRLERFERAALGRPYHAALIEQRGRSSPHGHRDYYEVMAIVSGDGAQDLGHWLQPLRPGDVVLVRPRDQHAIVGSLQFYNIAFPASSWRTFADMAGVDPQWEAEERPPHRRLDPGDDRAVRACAAVLERFQLAPTRFDLIRFWAEVVPVLADPAGAASPPSGTPDWLVAACAAMEHEEHLRVGVRRLQQLAHVSPAHLARSMRRYYQTTPSEFVAELRLRRAATLLATTTRSVTEIAYACGFTSLSYFSRCFATAHGASPRQFRDDAQRAFVP